MRRAENLKGQVFANGNIQVIRKYRGRHEKRVRWVCRCICGREFVEYGFNLKSGRRKSCGCLSRKSDMKKGEARKYTVSLLRILGDEGQDPYQKLANAIVAVAADDYRSALKNKDQYLQESLENFFRSNWYRELTEVDGEFLLDALKKDVGAANGIGGDGA